MQTTPAEEPPPLTEADAPPPAWPGWGQEPADLPTGKQLLDMLELARRAHTEKCWRAFMVDPATNWPRDWPALPPDREPPNLRSALIRCAHRLLGPRPMLWKEAEFIVYLVGQYIDRAPQAPASSSTSASPRRRRRRRGGRGRRARS